MNTSDAFWLFLPEGLDELFDMVKFEKTDKEFNIWLDERRQLPDEDRHSPHIVARGFTDYVTVQDFPMRGRPLYLHTCENGSGTTNRPARYTVTG